MARAMSAALRLLAEVCAVPTAPFVEGRVVAFVEVFARKHKLRVERDRWGNLLVSVGRKPRAGERRLVFTAHMDHPGFVSGERVSATEIAADFRGGVAGSFIPAGTRVRFFLPGGREARAVVVSTASGANGTATSAVLRVRGEIASGCAGMFELTPGKVAKGLFCSRVCDDLAGAAAALAAIEMLAAERKGSGGGLPSGGVAVLLTRGEEVGFVGALGAVMRPELLRKRDDLLVAIECSSAQAYAPVGAGVIIRVGDRTSIFNSSLTAFLNDTAQTLAKADGAFKFQRALMPGGTCESTVYDAWGYHAAAVCLALGNYHNMDKATGKLAPEFVSVADYTTMVKMFVALARSARDYAPGHKPLKQRLTQRFKANRHLLEQT